MKATCIQIQIFTLTYLVVQLNSLMLLVYLQMLKFSLYTVSSCSNKVLFLFSNPYTLLVLFFFCFFFLRYFSAWGLQFNAEYMFIYQIEYLCVVTWFLFDSIVNGILCLWSLSNWAQFFSKVKMYDSGKGFLNGRCIFFFLSFSFLLTEKQI